MAYPFWFSEDRWAPRGLLFGVIALNLAIVYINVLLNKWNNTFYDAFQDKNYRVFCQQLIRFCWFAGLFIVFAVYQFYLNQMLQIRWRRCTIEARADPTRLTIPSSGRCSPRSRVLCNPRALYGGAVWTPERSGKDGDFGCPSRND
jgi:hypothetical protein